jgi:hypothetical protein
MNAGSSTFLLTTVLEDDMRVIVTAQALVIMPGIVLRLNEQEAIDRKHCMQPLGGGLYRATLENHFKHDQVVEFEGAIPKQYITSCEPISDDGRALPPASSGVARVAHPQAATPAVTGIEHAAPSKQRLDLDGMTKAQLIEFSEQRHVRVDAGMNKAQIIAVLKKNLRADAA